MIEVQNLTKRYGSKTAVDNLSFQVKSGTVTGFLGPNGSGKSTTMRCMLGLDQPNQGQTLFDGVLYRDLPSPLTKVGALLDGKAFNPHLTAIQHLSIIAATHNLPKSRVQEVLKLTGIDSVAKKRLKGFSLGMGQRLGIATALLADPEVLILDEPVNGLDPDGVRWVRETARAFAAEGRTVLISSHLMSEMALTADHLVVLGRGKLIAQGPITEFTQSAANTTIKVSGPDLLRISQVLQNANISFQTEAPKENYPNGALLTNGSSRAEIGNLLYQHQLEIHELSESYSSLEEVFMELTNSSLDYQVDHTSVAGTNGKAQA